MSVLLGCVLLTAGCSYLTRSDEGGRLDRTQIDAAVTTTADSAPVESTLPPPEPALAFVSVGGDRQLVSVQIDPDGKLALLDQAIELPGAAGAMVYSQANRRLYVGAGNAIATIELDDAGVPSLSGVTPVAGEPVYLDLAAADQVLAVAFFGEDEVRSYAVAGEEPDSYPLLQTDAWDVEPHSIVVNDGGTRAYVAHRNGNTVGVYKVDPEGALSKFTLGQVDGDVGPRHIALSPAGGHAYVVNEFGDSIDVYEVGSDGNLAPLQTVSTLPAGTDGESNTGADIHITPDGKNVYASNRGHDSIAIFGVAEDGQLTASGHIETQARPREFDISPDGRFLVAAGQDSRQLESYAIAEDGQLTSLGVLEVGDGPVWVTIV